MGKKEKYLYGSKVLTTFVCSSLGASKTTSGRCCKGYGGEGGGRGGATRVGGGPSGGGGALTGRVRAITETSQKGCNRLAFGVVWSSFDKRGCVPPAADGRLIHQPNRFVLEPATSPTLANAWIPGIVTTTAPVVVARMSAGWWCPRIACDSVPACGCFTLSRSVITHAAVIFAFVPPLFDRWRG